jgi:N4-gp56 family major capsid protein
MLTLVQYLPLAGLALLLAYVVASVVTMRRHGYTPFDLQGFTVRRFLGDVGSTDTFTPEIWSKKLLSSLKKALVFGAPGVVNRDYEGEISDQGDTVHINSVSRPTVGTYTKGVTSIVPEQLTTAQRALVIDQAKYFAFEVDDIDRRQNAGDVLPEAMQEAAYALADTADQYLETVFSGVASANALGTIAVAAASPTAAYDSILVPLKVVLDEANVPTEGRFAIIPAWLHGRLLRDDRFIRADATGQAPASQNGMVGTAAGFRLHVSNNCPNTTGDDYRVTAGHPMAVSYAEQINKTEAYRPEDSFSDAVKGLHLYGAKLVRPTAAATAIASKT